MDWNIVWKILICIVAILIIHLYIEPLLIALLPPFGLIILVVVYLGILAWLFGFAGPWRN